MRAPRPYRGRFAFVCVALLAAVGAGVAGLVLALVGSGSGAKRRAAVTSSGRPWSTWVPTAPGAEAKANEIAEHVGRAYRLPNGDQLLDVSARRPFVNVPTGTNSKPVPIPVSYVVVKGVHGGPGEQTPLASGNSELYGLCGLGTSCSIPTGSPTPERLRLLRRESLELALYTFKYVDGVKYVITILPPGRTAAAANALYFQRRDFDRQLQQPLAETFSERTPISTIARRETQVIDRLTDSHLFSFRLLRNEAGALILGLTPLQS